MREAVRAGLDRVEALRPGHGFAEASAGVRGDGGGLVGFARGEVGARVDERLAVFAFAEAVMRPTLTSDWMAGVGARLTW